MSHAYKWTKDEDGTHRIKLNSVISILALSEPTGEHCGIVSACTLTSSELSAGIEAWRPLLLEAWTQALHDYPFLQVEVNFDPSKGAVIGSYKPPKTEEALREEASSRLRFHDWPKDTSPYLFALQGGVGQISANAPSTLHVFSQPGSKSVTLALMAEHVTSDAGGAMVVFNSIALQVAKARRVTLQLGKEVERLPLPLPAYLKNRKDDEPLSHEASQLLEKKKELMSAPVPPIISLANKEPAEKPTLAFHNRQVTLSREQTARLVQNVKAKGAKLGRVLIGVALTAAAHNLPSSSDGTHLSLAIAVVGRSLLTSSAHQEQVGVTVRSPLPLPLFEKRKLLDIHAHSSPTPADYSLDSVDQTITEWQSNAILPSIEPELVAHLFSAAQPVMPSMMTSFIGPMDDVLRKDHGSVTVSEPACGPLTAGPSVSFSGWSFDGQQTLRFFAHVRWPTHAEIMTQHLQRSHHTEEQADRLWAEFLGRVEALAQ